MHFLKKVYSLFKVCGLCWGGGEDKIIIKKRKDLNRIVLHSPYCAVRNTMEYASQTLRMPYRVMPSFQCCIMRTVISSRHKVNEKSSFTCGSLCSNCSSLAWNWPSSPLLWRGRSRLSISIWTKKYHLISFALRWWVRDWPVLAQGKACRLAARRLLN